MLKSIALASLLTTTTASATFGGSFGGSPFGGQQGMMGPMGKGGKGKGKGMPGGSFGGSQFGGFGQQGMMGPMMGNGKGGKGKGKGMPGGSFGGSQFGGFGQQGTMGPMMGKGKGGKGKGKGMSGESFGGSQFGGFGQQGMMGPMMGKGKGGKGNAPGGGMVGGPEECEITSGFSTLGGGNFASIEVVGDTRVISGNSVPHHYIASDRQYCVYDVEVELPLSPQYNVAITPLPTRGPVAYALNGVPIFGPQEGDSNNAVEGGGPIQVGCEGHPSPNGQWHYHHPDIGCTNVADKPDLLLGYALDGFPIYGALSGDKRAVDVQLDECNGRFVDGGYQYHVRTLNQVDESQLYENADGSNNWNYVLGCYHGTPVATQRQGKGVGKGPGKGKGKGKGKGQGQFNGFSQGMDSMVRTVGQGGMLGGMQLGTTSTQSYGFGSLPTTTTNMFSNPLPSSLVLSASKPYSPYSAFFGSSSLGSVPPYFGQGQGSVQPYFDRSSTQPYFGFAGQSSVQPYVQSYFRQA